MEERRDSKRVTAGTGSEICFGGRAERRIRWASSVEDFEAEGCVLVGSEEDGNTIPGESRSLSFLSSFTSRRDVVTPASAPTGAAVDAEDRERERLEVRALMTEDLPTLGYPIMPTVVVRLRFFDWA